METAYIGGTFDLFHAGHVELFRRAKEKFGHVVVALNTDEFATRYKRAPIMNLNERRSVIEACRYVDEVDINEGCEDSKPCIARHAPCVVIHGDDWKGEALMNQMDLTKEWLDDKKVRLEYLPYTLGISTSDIIWRIRSSPS